MFIAMNRFKVIKGCEDDFIKVWKERDSYLDEVPGFQSFQLLKGETFDDHTLFASHSIWVSREAFVAWTKSDAFKKAHQYAGNVKSIYLEHPHFEGFETVL